VVSRRLPTTAVRVGAQVRSCGICGGQSCTGAGFLQVLQFPLPIIIPLSDPHSWSITQGWYNRPVSCRPTKCTQSHPTPKKPVLLNMQQQFPCSIQSSSIHISSMSPEKIIKVIQVYWKTRPENLCLGPCLQPSVGSLRVASPK
jgi:hypothetical protein